MVSIRVLIVDDHPALCAGLQRMLSSDASIEVVGTVGSGEEALSLAKKTQPDVVLMDVRLPGMSGIDALRQLKAEQSNSKVVILTAYEDDNYLIDAIEAGASGYLLKDIGTEELCRAIRQTRNGKVPLSPSVTGPLMTQLSSLTKGGANARFRLTERQSAIMRLVAAGASNKEIAKSLYLSTATVKREMNRLFASLDVHDRAEAVSRSYQMKLL